MFVHVYGGGGATENCEECSLIDGTSTVSECSKCISGFGLEPTSAPAKPKCYQCQNGCSDCTVDDRSTPPNTINRCTNCLPNYALNNEGTCIKCPLNCSECRIDPENQNNTLCLTFGCIATALRDEDFTCESCSIDYCSICRKHIDDSFECLQCDAGYYKDNTGNCQACSDGCSFCLNGMTCIPHGCKEGFIRHRIDGTCIPCPGDGVARCSFKSITSDELVAELCKNGFRINTANSPTTCEECDPNCKKCDVNGISKCDVDECKSDYFFDSSDKKCYRNNDNCMKSTRQNGKIACSSCNTNISVLSDGKCVNCPNQCLGGCSFDKTNNKFTCISCIMEYYKTRDNFCKSCPTGCKTCSLIGDNVECTSCLPSYGLKKNGLCESCNVDKCHNCETTPGEDSLVCTSCAEAFCLNSEECGKCPINCLECSHTNRYECTKCMAGYAKTQDGTCIPCPSNCKICTANSNREIRCVKCVSNKYSLQTKTGQCIVCSEATFSHCATCSITPINGKTKCETCNIGYTLQDDEEACVSCSIDKCDLCIHGRVCSECKAGYYEHNYYRECAQKCFQCKGNKADCGRDLSKFNDTITDTAIQIVDCSSGDCWAYRQEKSGIVTYVRECSHRTCTLAAQNENCQTVEDKKECEKCCKGDKCNTWELDGKAGVGKIAFVDYFIIVFSFIFIVF
ncbi:DgyrCDS14539 [Dimorphilus gyrociliatus]|uniref:DgyrCDS14539 n=1 Tax=Dimorphilus gyrociliatus TaxID=2664684 RepID=A0A7I8WDX7_9ANNE|nr:DgyrCDS14539 [Dimorphilus gyrociliatus]